MEEREFNVLADAMLARIEQALEGCEVDIDFELKDGGVLEITCDNGSKIIINRHTAAREIWVAARSGGFHFDYDEEQGLWICDTSEEPLGELLTRVTREQAGEELEFDEL